MLSLIIELTFANVHDVSDTEQKVTSNGPVFINAENVTHFYPSKDGRYSVMHTAQENGFYVIEQPVVIIERIEKARREIANA